MNSDEDDREERMTRAEKIRDVMNKLRREGRRVDKSEATDRLENVLKWKAEREAEKKKEGNTKDD